MLRRRVGECDGARAGARWSGRIAAVAVVGIASLFTPASAFADADEASLHASAVAAWVRTTDHGAAGSGPLAGGAVRGTFARADRWAFDVAVAGFGGTLRHAGATETLGGVPTTGTIERTQLGGRLEVGVDARFGVRWIPILHVGLGVQGRRLMATTLRRDDGMVVADVAAATAVDVVGAVGVGLDRRLGRSLVIGVAVTGVRAQPLGGEVGAMTSLEATVHVAWYFYPRWFRLYGWRGSHGGES